VRREMIPTDDEIKKLVAAVPELVEHDRAIALLLYGSPPPSLQLNGSPPPSLQLNGSPPPSLQLIQGEGQDNQETRPLLDQLPPETAKATLAAIKEMGRLVLLDKDLVAVHLLSGRVLTWRRIPHVAKKPKVLPAHAPRIKKVKPLWELVRSESP